MQDLETAEKLANEQQLEKLKVQVAAEREEINTGRASVNVREETMKTGIIRKKTATPAQGPKGFQGAGEKDWTKWAKKTLTDMLLDAKECAVWVSGLTTNDSGLVKPCEVDSDKDYFDSYVLVKHGTAQSSLFYEFQILVHFKGIIGTCQPVYGTIKIGNITHGSVIEEWTHEVEQERKERCTTRRDYVKVYTPPLANE